MTKPALCAPQDAEDVPGLRIADVSEPNGEAAIANVTAAIAMP